MIRDIFISHNGADSEQAQALCDLLKSRDPELNIFLDCGEDHPLEQYEEWLDRMLKEAANSRYLIFLASRPEYLEEGNGWVYPEVLSFAKKSQTRKRDSRADRTIAWFGILLDGCPLRGEMYQDPKHGEQYRLMYDGKEHLCLPEGCGVEDAAQQIWDKFRTMVEGGGNAMAAELLVKVHAFAEEKAKVDSMFCPEEICDGLIPKLQLADPREGESWLNDSNRLIAMLQTNSVVLLGSEGGSGKTSLLTKLFYHHLPQKEDMSFFSQPGGMIPLYVDAKSLAGKDNLIRRHLARTLYDEDSAVTSEFTGETVDKLGAEFAQIRPQPRYLLLIDGYNEIPVQVQKLFDSELDQYLPGGRYQNVRVLIASRHMQRELPEEVRWLTIRRMDNSQIKAYLDAHKLFTEKLPKKLWEILSIPMYLKLYAQTRAGGRINSKGDLLTAYVKWQQEKVQKTAASQEQKAVTELLLLHFLPLLAYRLMAENTGDSTYLFQEQTWEETAEECLTLLESRSYKKHYGTQYREILSEARERKIKDELDLMDQAQKYLLKNSDLLRKNEDGTFEFFHQIYRDFFCAWFVAEEMKRSVTAGVPSQILKQWMLPEDVREFTAELLQEEKPVCHPVGWRWDYRCNENSVLYQLLCLARTAPEGKDQGYVANLLELLKYARGNDLSGCDFSGLDLRRCDLRTCVLTRRDGEGSYPACFAGAWLDRENLICDSHFAPIVNGCVGNGRVASLDRSGVIRIRVLPNINGVTEKLITHVSFRVQKILFAPEGDRIFAMTPHEILELPIPEERESVAQPRVLLKTTKRLRNILLDEQGQLCFTTVFNAFNPKPVTDPEVKDDRDFYGLNSVAAVNTAGTQVAFGHVAVRKHHGLRIYDYDEVSGQWLEKKFGYCLLLDEYMTALEQLLKEQGLYEAFPDDFAAMRAAGEEVSAHGSYFEYTLQEFSDRIHAHHVVPEIILHTQVLKELRSKKVEPTPEQIGQLEALAQQWAENIREATRSNPMLMHLAGRRIESLEYRPGTDWLMVSCVNDYKICPNKKNENVYLKATNSLLLELNTKTLETRFLSHYAVKDRHRKPLKGSYWDDGVLIFSNQLLTVRDHARQLLARVQTYTTTIDGFILLKDKGFLTVSRHFIYQFDPMGRCVAGWNSVFEPTNFKYVVDEEGRDYLIRTRDISSCKKGTPVQVLELSTGSYQYHAFSIKEEKRPMGSVSIGPRQYRMCAGQLTAFEKSNKADGFDIPYKLFVQNCDFRGVQGTINNEADRLQLFRFGAVTDPVEIPLCQVGAEYLTHTSSSVPFRRPEGQPWTPFVNRPDFVSQRNEAFDIPLGGEKLVEQKIWARIYEGSYTRDALEAADMSIMEWTAQLGYVTPEMIRLLIQAGVVEPPTGYDATEAALKERMDRLLHSGYRLLTRWQFCREEERLDTMLYSLTGKFGVNLVRETGGTVKKPDADPNEASNYALCRQLVMNQWFCRMMAAYPGKINRYAMYEEFSSECHWFTRATVHGFVVVDKQPVFLLVTRQPFDETREQKTVGMLDSICRMTSFYKNLTCNHQPEPLDQIPVVVIIGEDYNHCQYLNSVLGKVAPFVRKLYTYDALLHGDETAPPRHFSFFHGQPMEEDIQNLK